MSDPTGQISALKQDIVDLQSKLQFQEDTIQQLDSVVVEQNEYITMLTRRFVMLEEKISELAERDYPKSMEQEKPPHY